MPMCDVNPSFQSMHIEKTYPESAYRLARLMALCKHPQIEDLIVHLTDAEFLAGSLAIWPCASLDDVSWPVGHQ